MTGPIFTVLIVTLAGAALLIIACTCGSRRSTVEKAFDNARAQGDWASPEELLDAFAAAAEGSSEAELQQLARQLSHFNRRLDQMKRQIREEK